MIEGEKPERIAEMDINALNYCRFSIATALPSSTGEERDMLIALPNLVESAYADIWKLASQERLHAAVGKRAPFSNEPMDGRGQSKSGAYMSLFPAAMTPLRPGYRHHHVAPSAFAAPGRPFTSSRRI